MESVEQYVVTLVRSLLPGHSGRAITRDLDLVTDLGADSMSLVSIIFSLDEKFGSGGTAELGDLMQECRTVGDLIGVAEGLQGEYGTS